MTRPNPDLALQDPILLTLDEAGARAMVSGWTVYAWLRKKWIPSDCVRRIGKHVRIHRERFEAWLSSVPAETPLPEQDKP